MPNTLPRSLVGTVALIMSLLASHQGSSALAQSSVPRSNSLPRLFSELRSGDESSRVGAAWSLVRLRPDTAWDLSVAAEALTAEETHVRRTAAKVLGAARGAQQQQFATRVLRSRLEDEFDYYTKFTAIESLVRIGALDAGAAARQIDDECRDSIAGYLELAIEEEAADESSLLVAAVAHTASQRLFRLGAAERATSWWLFGEAADLTVGDPLQLRSGELPAEAVPFLIDCVAKRQTGWPAAVRALGEFGLTARRADQVLLDVIARPEKESEERPTELLRLLSESGIRREAAGVRVLALDALGRIGAASTDAKTCLRRATAEPGDGGLAAACSLARIGDPAGVDRLRSALREGTDPIGRARLLGMIGHLEADAGAACEDVIAVLRTTDDPARAAAGIALARIGAASCPHLFQAFDAGDQDVQIAVCASLEQMQPFPDVARRGLLERFSKAAPLLRTYIARTLAEANVFDENVLVPVLAKQTASTDVAVRQLSAWVLSEVPSPGPLLQSELIRLATHEDTTVASLSIDGLRRAGPGQAALPTLLKIVRDEREYVAGSALYALGHVPSGDGLPLLIRHAQGGRMGWCTNAILALEKQGRPTPEVLQCLTSLCSNGDAYKRARAALALLALGQPDIALRTLNAVIDDAPAKGMFASMAPEIAARSIGGMGPQGRPALPLLKRLMQDEIPSIRVAAATAVLQLQPKEGSDAFDLLMQHTRNAESSVRRAALDGLALGKDQPGLEWALKMALEDPDPELQRGAWRLIRNRRSDAELSEPTRQ